MLVADGHAPTRVEVASRLERAGFVVCATAGDAAAAVAAAVRERPHACLLDVRLPGGGIRAAAEIVARLPLSAVLMLTFCVGDLELFAALGAGARGYLLKHDGLARVPGDVAAALRGEAPLSGAVAARLVDEFRERGPRRRVLLSSAEVRFTSREWEIVELLRDGHSTAVIARRLSVAPATVRSHVRAVLAKVGARDRRGALERLGYEAGGARA